MALVNPFVIGQNRKLSLSSVNSGFGYCDNLFPDNLYKVAPDFIFPTYDILSAWAHISLIRYFEQGQDNIIKRIVATLGRLQVGSGAGAPIAPQRSICRIVIIRNPPSQENLPYMVFDPLFYDKTHATEAGTTGVDYEVAAAWPNNRAGKIFNWRGADIVFSILLTLEGVHNLQLDLNLSGGSDYVVIMTPAYHDRNFLDAGTGVISNLWDYAGGVGQSGTDFRQSPVARTLNVIGEVC